MKSSTKLLVLLAVFGATLASAQILKHFDHIVIIVQENRTPDNLFGSNPNLGCGASNPFEPGVDIQNGGLAKGLGNLCNHPVRLALGADLDHKYSPGWLGMWDNGAMDGACGNNVYNPGHVDLPECPQYSYVIKSDVQPYFDIATNYGFANYFFQTNEGPSFPGHQFLLSGTSAPWAPALTATWISSQKTGGTATIVGVPMK
jgi:phospholipase C